MNENNKPTIAYMCSYVPAELISSLGFNTVSLLEAQMDHMGRNVDWPVNMCSFVHCCIDMIDNIKPDAIIVTNCCNSMQRLYDYIAINRPELYCCMLDLPRDTRLCDHVFYKETVAELVKKLSRRFQKPYPGGIETAVIEYMYNSQYIDENTIYILGSALSAEAREKLAGYLAPYKIITNQCPDRSNRNFFSLKDPGNKKIAVDRPILYFNNLPCARMSCFTGWFTKLIEKHQSCLTGILYISSRHCDSFLFRYPSVHHICAEYGIPVLFLEEEYNLTGFNRILTRLEAFMENLEFRRGMGTDYQVTDKIGVKRVKDSSDGFSKKIRLVESVISKLPLESIRLVVANQVDLFSSKMWNRPKDVIWTNMVMTVEILYAAGLLPVNMELVAGWLASLGLSRQYISRCEGMGLSPSLCSYHKATIGLLENSELPRPRGAVVSTHICDGGPGTVYYFADRHDTDIFVLNLPYHYKPSGFKYMMEQYEKLIKWLEAYSGRKISHKKLAEAMEMSNLARMYWMKALELRKGRPLFEGHLSLRNLFGTTFLFGSELGVKVAKAYYEQLLEGNKGEEQEDYTDKFRLLWIHFAPLYCNKIMEYLERELNCRIVMDITGYIYWDKYDVDKPLESLVKKCLSHFYMGNAARRKAIYRRLIKEYNVDGIIHFMHNGCRAISGSSWLVRDTAREMGLAYMELTGDCIDPRGFSEEQFRMRLEAFRETLGRDIFVSGN